MVKISRKIQILAIILILIIGMFISIYYIFREKPIINSPYTVAEVKRNVTGNITSSEFEVTGDNWVALTNVTYEGEDVTDKIDAEEFIGMLSENKCKLTLASYSPHNESDVTWEIDLVYNSRPIHIILGDFNVWFESADKSFYEISDPDSLKACLENYNISSFAK